MAACWRARRRWSRWKKSARWWKATGRRSSSAGEIKPLAQTVTEEGVTATEPAAEPITGDDVLIEIGGKNTLPAFNDALRGTKVGQELTFEVVYPADFGERRLAGQTVGYDVTVKAIKQKTYPERDAELAKQLGGSETLGGVREPVARAGGQAQERGAGSRARRTRCWMS